MDLSSAFNPARFNNWRMASSSSFQFVNSNQLSTHIKKPGQLTIDDDAMLKARLSRVAYQEEYVDITNEPYLTRPSFVIDENIPRVDITRRWLLGMMESSKQLADHYILIAFQNFIFYAPIKSAENTMVRCHFERTLEFSINKIERYSILDEGYLMMAIMAFLEDE